MALRRGAATTVLVLALLIPAAAPTQDVGQRTLLDNDQVVVVEVTFSPGFRGDEHAAIANEFAYVLEGELAVVTQGQRKRVFGPGEIEYAGKGTVHYSLNETKKPARVLVVLLKDR